MKFTTVHKDNPTTAVAIPNRASIVFDNRIEAASAISKASDLGDLPGSSEDYIIKPCTDDGQILERLSEEDNEQIKNDIDELVKNSDVGYCLALGLVSRRLYGIATTKLEDVISACKPDAHPCVIDALVQIIADKAQEPYEFSNVLTSLDNLLPVIKQYVTEHDEAMDVAAQEDYKRRSELRAAVQIPTPFNADDSTCRTLDRDTSVVVIGDNDGVRYVLEAMAKAATAYEGEEYPWSLFTLHYRNESDADPTEACFNYAVAAQEKLTDAVGDKELLNAIYHTAYNNLDSTPDLLIFDDIKAIDSAVLLEEVSPVVSVSSMNQACKRLTELRKTFNCAVVLGAGYDGYENTRGDVRELPLDNDKMKVLTVSVGAPEENYVHIVVRDTAGKVVYTATDHRDNVVTTGNIITPGV